MAEYGKCHVDYLEEKKTQRITKNKSGDSSHQALTIFFFSEIFITHFRNNNFPDFHVGNSTTKICFLKI